MKKMKKWILFIEVLALISLLLPEMALAFNHYTLDVEALKEVERRDSFDVQITRKSINEHVNSDFKTPDDLILEVSNRSSYQVSELVIKAVAYDENGLTQKIDGSVSALSTGQEARKLLTFTVPSLNLKPGEAVSISQPCSYSEFAGIRAVVSEYTTSDGQTFINPCYEAWEECALGNPTRILD